MKPIFSGFCQRHRARAFLAACLLFLLAACGGSSDAPESPMSEPVLLASVTTSAAVDQFEVVGLQKIAEKRINRTVYEYSYLVSIRNNGTANATNVMATLATVQNGTEIVDATAAIGTIKSGATATPASDVVVLRQDRTIPFNPAGLGWKFTSVSNIELEAAKPAELVIIALADIGFPAGADKVIASGAVSDALLKEGTLRFSTPGDTGVDQDAAFEIAHGASTTALHVLIRTQRPSAALAHVEPLDDGSPASTAPTLTVAGLGPNNTITSTPLTFKLQGIAQLDLKDDSDGLVVGTNNVAVSLKKFWTFDPADSSFSISGTALQQLLSALPNGALTVALNFVSKDGEFAVSYELLAMKQGARLSGKLQTPQGNAVTGLAGKKILLKGFNAQMRAVAPVDANGGFSFEGVIPDTYQLTLNDLENPGVVNASTVIFAGTTQADVTLVVALATANQPLFKQAAPASAMVSSAVSSFVSSSITQNGKAPSGRNLPAAGTTTVAPSKMSKALAANGASATFSATAAAQNQTITTQIGFPVPMSTQNVGVKVTVFSAEYPVYTTKQSQFNDTWSYSINGLPATVLSASGSVNQSHFTQGTTTKTTCVDVSAQTKKAALNVSGAVSATNIGDSALTTITTVELTLGCAGLKVTSATFSSPNVDSHPVIEPIKTQGNLQGPYLSIQQSGLDATHTLPLAINFSPVDAKITEVNIGVSPDGNNPAFSSDNLLGQAHASSAGKITFSKISLPAFAGSMDNGKVVVTVRIKGTVENTETSSDPAEGGQVGFDGKTAFTPLYLAGNIAGLASRRYGTRDAGGDSWATKQTIDWLGTKAYRFDDLTGLHVTQTSTGRSILGHSGHSDGQQLDLRYADGQGGYSDALGGQGNGLQIQQLINAAAAEVASNAAQKPKLAALKAWIVANRTLLDVEAAAASTRVIYMGPSFIKLALIDGKFSSSPTAAIPGVTQWVKPARVQIDAAHLSHWHMSMTAHP